MQTGRSFYVLDPDGVPVELWERMPDAAGSTPTT